MRTGRQYSMLRKFIAPEILFGNGARKRLADYLATLRIGKLLLVSDPGLREAGWTDEIEDDLKAAGIGFAIWEEVSPNPRYDQVNRGAEAYLSERCDMIVALGGGSPMDAAKGIGIVASNGGDIRDYEGVDRIPAPMPPTIFIPSTAGTAADLSQFAIINNDEERYKMAIISKSIVPDVSLMDPDITMTMDPDLTAATGLDALTHAFEALASTGGGPMTDLYALEAISLVGENLVAAVRDGSDAAARERMCRASGFAGLAFSNASLGAVHAMAHSLGGYLDKPHGECNALLLETVISRNFPEAAEAYRRAAGAMGLPNGPAVSDDDVRNAILEKLNGLRRDVGMDHGLASLGVNEDAIPTLAEKAASDPCLLTNPMTLGTDELEEMFRIAL